MRRLVEAVRLYVFERRQDVAVVGLALAAAVLGGRAIRSWSAFALLAAMGVLWWFRPWRRR